MSIDAKPVLWHVTVSHFSEKIRWALDRKQIPHVRRAPPPGAHIAVAWALTRGHGFTLPVLQLADRTIGDSTAIIAALEELYPQAPLYPADAATRERALMLEDWFDENLGSNARRLAFYELRGDPELLGELAAGIVPALARVMGPGLVPYTRAFTGLRYRAADPQAAEEARAGILAGLDKLELELDGGAHLAGDEFSVADLTAASLFYPVVMPVEARSLVQRMPAPFEDFRAQISERPGYRWVQDTYRRHRWEIPVAEPAR